MTPDQLLKGIGEEITGTPKRLKVKGDTTRMPVDMSALTQVIKAWLNEQFVIENDNGERLIPSEALGVTLSGPCFGQVTFATDHKGDE